MTEYGHGYMNRFNTAPTPNTCSTQFDQQSDLEDFTYRDDKITAFPHPM
jgi:hypothetical protein